MTWVKWGAIDRYKAENAHLFSGIDRPITPPTDDEHATTSLSTPRAVTPLLASTAQVPGQPRKTPGAKLHHACAPPETADILHDDVFIDQLHTQAIQSKKARSRSMSATRSGQTSATGSPGRDRSLTPAMSMGGAGSKAMNIDIKPDEEMLPVDSTLVIVNPHREESKPARADLLQENEAPTTAYVRTATGLREITPPTVIDSAGNVISKGSHASSASGAPSSRIGKPRPQRPLSTITDNRQMDKHMSTHALTDSSNQAPRNSGSGGPARSKVAGPLNTPSSLEVGNSGGSGSAPSSERYNLRAGRANNGIVPLSTNSSLSSAGTSSTVITTTTGTVGRNNNNTTNGGASNTLTTATVQVSIVRPVSSASNHSGASPSRLPRVTKSKREMNKLGIPGSGNGGSNHHHLPSQAGIGNAPVTRSVSGGRRGASATHASGPVSTAPVSQSARIARNARRRRSSTGEV